MSIQTKMSAADQEALQAKRMKDLVRTCRERMKESTRTKPNNRQMKKCHKKKLHKMSNKVSHKN